MANTTILSLFSGIGGIELGIKRALPNSRVVGYVEREVFPAFILLERMEEQALDPAPLWCGNIEQFDAKLFQGVEIVTAGFPCQPVSTSGKQKGIEDERWMWPAIVDVLRVVQPQWVFLENVPGIVRGGHGVVIRDLASLGYDAEWDCVRAPYPLMDGSRYFLLAKAYSIGLERRIEIGAPTQSTRREGKGHPEPVSVGVDTRPPDWVDRLRAIGNSCSPEQAEDAFRLLFKRHGEAVMNTRSARRVTSSF